MPLLAMESKDTVKTKEVKPPVKKTEVEKSESELEAEAEQAKVKKAKTAKAKKPVSKRVMSLNIKQWIRDLDDKNEVKGKAAFTQLVEAKELASKEIKSNIKRHNSDTRMAAIGVLKQINDKDSRLAIAKRAVFDTSRKVRIASATALKEMKSGTARRYILDKAISRDDKTRYKATRAISNIADRRYMEELVPMTLTVMKGHVKATYDIAVLDPKRSRTVYVETLASDGIVTAVDFQISIKLPVVHHMRGTMECLAFDALAQRVFMKPRQLQDWWIDNRDTYNFPNLDPKAPAKKK